jgi:cleavage stimulation factor subunit 3
MPTPAAPPVQHKRGPSPDHKRRESDPHGPPQYKRARAASPPARDRERWEGHGGGRKRYNSPSWDRDRERDAPPPRRARDNEEEKAVNVPSVISWFIGTLPGPSVFDGLLLHPNCLTLFLESSDHVAVGPVFRTDDLMQVFRGAVIPSVTGRSRSPPPAPRAGECQYHFPDSLRYLTTQEVGGRPPPDYGPYQGPGGPGGPRRRY